MDGLDAFPELMRIINGIQNNGGMPPIHERHVAIYQLMKSNDKELPFAMSSVSGESCAENDMANTYFNRDSDPNFKRLCQEFKANPKAYFNKFKKMNPAPVFHEVVEPQEVNLETFVCLFNENWTVADHEYMPQFFPRFPKEFKKGNLDMLERWAKREMLTARPGATPENLLDGFKSVEDAMNYMIYKTPHFGGPKSRVGFVWQDLMAGKSVRPDQDADNGKVFAYFENGELVPGEFFDQFDDKKPKERKKEKKGPESPMAVVWPSGEVFTNCSTSSSKKSKKTKQAEKTASCPDCEKEKKAESQDDLDEFPDF